MKIYDLHHLLQSQDSNEKIIAILNNYFFCRIKDGKVLSEDELEDLKTLVKEINGSTKINNKARNKMLEKIKLLLVLSTDGIRYDTFFELSSKLSKLNDYEILEYLDIVFSNCSFCITDSFLEFIINQYLDVNGNPSLIVELLCKYSDLIPLKKLKELKEFIVDNSLRVILKNIKKELEKDEVSYEIVQDYFNQLGCLNVGNLTKKQIVILKEILDKFNECDELLIKMDSSSFYRLKNQINNIYDDLVSNLDINSKIRNDIVSGKIQFVEHPKLYSVDLNFDDLSISTDDRIITIDDEFSRDLDGAFSIQKMEDIYILNVYVSDVPTFLMKNRKVCKEAYNRGNSFYVHNYRGLNIFNIDMIPPFISHKYLSLNLGHPKNVIEFNFVISANGEIYSQSVDRKKIIVTDKLTPKETKKIIESNENFGLLQNDLRNYKELCKVVSDNSSDVFLKQLDCNSIDDLVGFSSVLVNYFIGHEADFAIYRNNGKYSKSNEGYYTHSVTPIRRFVSDINLAFFLNQNGVVNFPNEDLYYVKDHLDEVIEHLNYKNEVSKFVDKNPNFVKKYIKIK